jgi:hypothetical protein
LLASLTFDFMVPRISREPPVSPGPPGNNLPDLVRRILELQGTTLFALSRESRERYRDPQFHLPHQLYSDLRLPSFTPSLPHIFALSSLTGYRLADWLTVFGFHVKHIPAMQATLPAKRTRLIDAALYDSEEWISWFTSRSLLHSVAGVLPVSQLLLPGVFRRAAAFYPPGRSPFLYLKVGWQDVFAFPDLVPGSIVRVDTRKKGGPSSPPGDSAATILLVEHARGFCLCRAHSPRPGRLTIRSSELPYAQIELELGRQARILGAADLELRPLVATRAPQVPRDLLSYGNPEPLPPASSTLVVGPLLALARARAGLSFREASAVSQIVARELGDQRYFCAPGALLHYETRNQPPRRVHKLIALLIVYSLGFETVLSAAGLAPATAGQHPMPESVLPRPHGAPAPPSEPGFLPDLVRTFEEIPLFLSGAVGPLAGLTRLSLRDIYWLGGHRDSLHPYLKDAVLAALNRRSKTPVSLPGKTLSAQPVYILLTRSNGYLLTACRREANLLVAQPFADGFDRPRRFRNGVDAEVVGRVVALLRWLR